MSREFAVSFLSICFDAGLSKEAAAELLQKETVDQELRRRPAFAAGYVKAASAVPGGLRPLLAGYELEKLATPSPSVLGGLRDLGRALFKTAPKAVVDIGRGAVGNTASGVKKVQNSSFLQAHPFAAMLGGSAVTGAGVLGLNAWANRDQSLMPAKPMPLLSPSGYSPEAYKNFYDAQLKSHTPGIFAHNKDYFGTEGRRKELEKAVAEGKGGNEAYLELQALNRQHDATAGVRSRHLDSLEGYQADNRELVSRIAERTQQLENQRRAWWAAPQRWWLSATGRSPQAYFDQKISELQGSRSQAQMEADLAADRQRLLWAGATEQQEQKQPSRQEIQERFFPQF